MYLKELIIKYIKYSLNAKYYRKKLIKLLLNNY